MNKLKFLNTHDLLRHYSKNSTNNIEDPIFTGFTFAIDKLSSPLFFNGEEYATFKTLRSPDGMDVQENENNTPLAERIEEKLKEINDRDILGTPNTYETSTIKAKDPFGTNNGRKPGYGLWDEHDIDKPLYGAVDYIYMVDKVVEGTTYSKSDYIGNGTPNKSIYDTYAEELSNVNIFFNRNDHFIKPDEESTISSIIKTLKDNPDCTITLDGYADVQTGNPDYNLGLSERRVNTVKSEIINGGIDVSRIKTDFHGDKVQPFAINAKNRAVICKFIGKIGKEDQKTFVDMDINKLQMSITDEMNAANEAKKEVLKTAKENYMSVLKKYKALRDVEDLQNAIDEEKRNVKSDLSDFKSTIEKKLEILKTSSDNDIRSTTKNEVEKIWDDFQYMVNSNIRVSSDGVNNAYEHLVVVYKSPDEKTIENELNSIRKDSKINDSDEEILKNIIVIMKTNINNVSVKDDSVNDLNTKRKDKKELEEKLFGAGTESNPTAVYKDGKLIGSLGYLYNKANEDYETDQVTSINNHIDFLNDAKENIDNTNAYTEKMSGSSSTQRTTNETIATDIESGETKKPTKEVPQTVYDILGFIYGMKTITEDYPYVLQSITGLDEAYKKYFEMKDPYMGSGDNKITIDCLEFLDMRVSSMFNKYFNAVYDRHYRRERVPINLRRFNCSVFVHDIRNFRNSINVKDEDISNIIGDPSILTELALNYMSAVEFKFFDCEIVPEETGSIFENVTNLPSNEMRNTKLVFTYGNCVINFLPFDDLRQYVLKKNKDLSDLEPFHKEAYSRLTDVGNNEFDTSGGLDGNFRRWFDKSLLGNVNNNDYREYIRRDASVAVDDHYKTTIVNDFALGSVAEKNKELTRMNDALRRLVTGVAASTGVPTEGVADALNIGFIKPILNETDKAAPVAKNLGNVTNSKIIDTETTEYIGTAINEEQKEPRPVKDLGNVNTTKGGN